MVPDGLAKNSPLKKLPRELTVYSSSPDDIGNYMFNWKILLAFVKNSSGFRPHDIMNLGYSEKNALRIYGHLYFNSLAKKQEEKFRLTEYGEYMLEKGDCDFELQVTVKHWNVLDGRRLDASEKLFSALKDAFDSTSKKSDGQ